MSTNTSNNTAQNPSPVFLPLPKSATISDSLGEDACPWLDEYAAFSQEWSPRSFGGFHEAIGIWVLSTIAARRVAYDLGKTRYTNLYIALVGRTSVAAKSTAAQIGKAILIEAGLDWLLLPDTCTPQKMVNMMTSALPGNFNDFSDEQKERIKQSISLAGQRGWYIDEFGAFVSSMMQVNGTMADFRGHIRRFDDTELSFQNATIGRGFEVIERPYLALLACLTPADLLPFAQKGSALWGDGFLARFALIAPPIDFNQPGQFPHKSRVIPKSLINTLQEWHESLKMPKLKIDGPDVTITPQPDSPLGLSKEAFDAYYAYLDGLTELIASSRYYDLDGNYSRLPDKALRMAALFASIQKSPKIEINHWAKAQGIAERLRSNLHDLISQLGNSIDTKKISNEEKVIRVISTKRNPTKREIEQSTGFNSSTVQTILDILVEKNELVFTEEGRTKRFSIPCVNSSG